MRTTEELTDEQKRQSHFDEWARALELWNDAAAEVRAEVDRFQRVKSQHESLWQRLIEARELAAKTLKVRRVTLDEAMPRPTIQQRDAL